MMMKIHNGFYAKRIVWLTVLRNSCCVWSMASISLRKFIFANFYCKMINNQRIRIVYKFLCIPSLYSFFVFLKIKGNFRSNYNINSSSRSSDIKNLFFQCRNRFFFLVRLFQNYKKFTTTTVITAATASKAKIEYSAAAGQKVDIELFLFLFSHSHKSNKSFIAFFVSLFVSFQQQ